MHMYIGLSQQLTDYEATIPNAELYCTILCTCRV